MGICLPSIPYGTQSVGKIRKEPYVRDRTRALCWSKRVWSLDLLRLSMEPVRDLLSDGVLHLSMVTLCETALAAQIEHISSESADALETIFKGVRSAGFSKDVAERVARGKLL